MRGPIHAHQYVISGWDEVPEDTFERFAAFIRRRGYPATYVAPYRPGVVMRNVYLDLAPWTYWRIGAQMCRELTAHATRVPVGKSWAPVDDQLKLF